MTTTPQDPLAELLRVVKQYDDEEINQPESCPTGTDYNNLFSLVTSYIERVNAPLPSTAPKQEPLARTVYECPDCDWTGTMDQLNRLSEIENIDERVEPGELVPAGCCPNCERLLPVEDCNVPHHTLYEVGLIMRQRGWTVTAPADCPSLDTVKGA
jgi:hypothetical protein